MGMSVSIRPDADRGMPRWGVAPSHGLDGRNGIAAPGGRGATARAPAPWTAEAVSVRTAISCPATREVSRTRSDRHRERRKRRQVTAPRTKMASSGAEGRRTCSLLDSREQPTPSNPPLRQSGGDGFSLRSSDAQIVQSINRERNRRMARTRRSRRSYGAGEWGRNRVRIFPDPKTYVDASKWASLDSELGRWQPGQVLSYVRPLGAAMLAAGPYGVREIGSKSG